MKYITLDIETRSSADLEKCGAYRYTESLDFAIILLSVSIDGGEVQTYDLACGETIPEKIVKALSNEKIIKRAWNAGFERICLSEYLGQKYLSPISWEDDMVHARYLGLPSALDDVGNVLNIGSKKLDIGKELIRFFCIPKKDGTFNSPSDFPDKWRQFKEYNKRDVEAELEIQRKLSPVPVPDFIWKEYWLSELINDRGILVDTAFAEQAIPLCDSAKITLLEDLKQLTGLANPNSVVQMKKWLSDRGIKCNSLDKKAVDALLPTVPKDVADILILRQQLSKSSVKKYEAMLDSACSDGRARGMFSFYGASRTGRFSGKRIQLQNLPVTHIDDIANVRNDVISGKFEPTTDTLSQLIRTAFVPAPDKKFIVADFSAIEARVVAWLAGEAWRIRAFANGEDIYCTSASKIYGVPVVKNGINGDLRQKGKIAELACAYGGSVGAMKNMGGSDLKLSDEELQALVVQWRQASPNIVKLWNDVGNAAKTAVKSHRIAETHGLVFSYEGSFLFIRLPSGRRLAYAKPAISTNRFGGECIVYMGVDSNKNWSVIETYGAKLVENIVQGIARDILLHAMQNLSSYAIVAHVHDEVIIECDRDAQVDEICDIMGKTPHWANGLQLKAEGYECEFYMKK